MADHPRQADQPASQQSETAWFGHRGVGRNEAIVHQEDVGGICGVAVGQVEYVAALREVQAIQEIAVHCAGDSKVSAATGVAKNTAATSARGRPQSNANKAKTIA